jgi:hypothetical protein
VKKSWNIIVVLVLFVCAGCHDNSPSSPSAYVKNGREALIIVVENNNSLTPITQTAFELYKDKLLRIFSETFGVPEEDMQGMPLSEIIDEYGEAWMVRELEAAATPYYTKVVTLTDSTATSQNVLDTIKTLATEGFILDIMFVLHGSRSRVWFADSTVNIANFTEDIASEHVSVRALYQTCCYGSFMIDEWEQIGIIAVNGAKGLNSLSMFSPIYFLQKWTSGMTFKNAVESAYQDEITKLKSYNTEIPVIDFILTDQVLDESSHTFGGQNSSLLWREFAL